MPKLFWHIPKNNEQFKEEVFQLVQNEYEVTGVYKNTKTKIGFKHIDCGHDFRMSPNNFLRGSRCPKCFGTPKKSHEEFCAEISALVQNEYEILGQYKTTMSKIKMKHNVCNHEWNVIPKDFLAGSRCPKCSGLMRQNTEIFKLRVAEMVNDEYEVLGEYKNQKTKIKMKHNVCNHEWSIVPNAFFTGNRCPKCKESKGEKAITDFLTNYSIEHQTQYKFDDCKDKRKLPFDFAIIQNNKPVMLIEFDGRQHFQNSDFYGGEKEFKEIQRRDKIKNEYCQNNNFKLVRIPYWELENIEMILLDALTGVIPNLEAKINADMKDEVLKLEANKIEAARI